MADERPVTAIVHTPDLLSLGSTLDFDESVQDLADVFYDLGGPGQRERFIDYAQRVTDALAEAGYVIVPASDSGSYQEPTHSD